MLEYVSMGSTCTLSACKAINKCRIGGGNYFNKYKLRQRMHVKVL